MYLWDWNLHITAGNQQTIVLFAAVHVVQFNTQKKALSQGKNGLRAPEPSGSVPLILSLDVDDTPCWKDTETAAVSCLWSGGQVIEAPAAQRQFF